MKNTEGAALLTAKAARFAVIKAKRCCRIASVLKKKCPDCYSNQSLKVKPSIIFAICILFITR